MGLPASFKPVPTLPTLSIVALIVFCLSLGLMDPEGGCSQVFPQEDPLVTINPESGTLVIGRGNSIDVTVRIQWPFNPSDARYVGSVSPLVILPSPLDFQHFERIPESVDAGGGSSSGGTNAISLITVSLTINSFSMPPPPLPPSGVYNLMIGGKPFQLTLLESGSFEMVVDPNFDRQTQGTTRTRIVRLIRAPGFASPVDLTIESPTQGITAAFDPRPLSGDTSFMRLTVDDSVSFGVKNLRVIGTVGNVTKMASCTVDVVADQYIVHLTQDSLWLTPGQNTQVTVSVTGSHLPATLSAPNEPNVVSFTFSPNPTSSTSTMSVSINPLAPAGTRRIPVTGTFSDGQTARDTLTLNIASSAQWRTVFFQNGVSLFGLGFFGNSSTGFGMAVTQSAAKSTDGGRSWSFVNPPPSQADDVAVVGPLQAIAVGGNNKIMRTYDGGISWVERNSGLTSGSWLAIGFNPTSPNIGVVVGRNGVITRTTNGGDDWVAVSQENASSPHWYDVSLYGSTGTIVGASSLGFNGRILRSTDSGLTWNPQTAGTTEALNAVSFTNANAGMIVGYNGTILKTTNGGVEWLPITSSSQATFYDVAMLNSQQATAVGSGGTILHTTDGGQTWVPQSVPVAAQTATLWKVYAFPDYSAVCLGNEFGCIILRRDSPLSMPFGNQRLGLLKQKR